MTTSVKVYFNPSCSKCRSVGGLLEERGLRPDYLRYLDAAPTRAELETLMQQLGIDDPRDMMRTQEARYRELQLESADRDELLEAMTAHPVLIQRPIVIHGDKAVIARPPEKALELLELQRRSPET